MNHKKEYDLEKLVNNCLDLLSIQRLDGTVLQVNPSFERILGWKAEELVGKQPFHLLHPEDMESTSREFEKLNQGLPTLSFQNRFQCADGSYKFFSWTAFPDTAAGFIYVTGRDITEAIEANRKISQLAAELKEANDRLFEQASTDPLTGLKNRRAFTENLRALLQCHRETFFSLMMIDVDHFKEYNDTFGHPAGDKVLIQLSSLLSEALSDQSVIARFGGEEFIVALPETSEENSILIAERLLQITREFSWEKKPVTISVGVATFLGKSKHSLEDKNQLSDLIESADKALYHSKIHGRNRSTHASGIECA